MINGIFQNLLIRSSLQLSRLLFLIDHACLNLCGLMQAKSNLQRALGRPVALEEASGMSIGEIKALEGDSGGAEAAPAGAPEEAAPAEAAPPPVETGRGSVAKIYPAKLIDLEHDLPVRLPVRPSLIKVKDGAHSVASVKKGIKSAPSTASLNAPPTPDRQVRALPPRSLRLLLQIYKPAFLQSCFY